MKKQIKILYSFLALSTLLYGSNPIFLDPTIKSYHKDILELSGAYKDKIKYIYGTFLPSDNFGISIYTDSNSSLADFSYKILKENAWIPSLSYTYRYDKDIKKYIYMQKRFKYIKTDFGFEIKDEKFYGGLKFLYSPTISLSYQRSTDKKNNFWIDLKIYNLLFSVGKIDKKYAFWFNYKLNLNKDYFYEYPRQKDNQVFICNSCNYFDALEEIFDKKSYNDLIIHRQGFTKKLKLNSIEYNYYKQRKVSKNYIKNAINISDINTTKNFTWYDIYLESKQNLYLSRTKKTKSNEKFNFGGNIGFNSYYINYLYNLKNHRTEKSTINLIKNSKNNHFRLEAGKYTNNFKGFTFEYLKTYKNDRLGLGATFQKVKNKNQKSFEAKYINAYYIPKRSNLVTTISIGKYFNNTNIFSLESKKVYKEFIAGIYLKHQLNNSFHKIGFFIDIPIKIKNFTINEKVDASNNQNIYYIKSPNSLLYQFTTKENSYLLLENL